MFPIVELGKEPGMPCPHCNKGCTIWENKPKSCTELECVYYQMEKASEDLRPDNCGVIFEKIADDVFLGSVYSIKELSPVVAGQIEFLVKSGTSVIMVARHKHPLLCLAKGHSAQYVWQTLKNFRGDDG
jgi:hypothetical protein